MTVDIGLPMVVISMVELLFVPSLAISLAIPLLRSRNLRNFIFLGLLTILFVCDVLFFLWESVSPLYIALFAILTMVSVIGGRIIPAFTVSTLRYRGHNVRQYNQTPLDIAALVSLIVLMAVLSLEGSESTLLGVCAIISALIHAIRLRGYHTSKTYIDPMLWILHAGYIWLIIGLGLLGVSGFGYIKFATALHALTVGSIGSMTIGMMCRVALGHTGRAIKATPAMIGMFISMQLAAVIRVAVPVAFPDYAQLAIVISAVLWSGVFLLYSLYFMPILRSERPDGTLQT
jgi:uncharacterized protein involved in response to NO